MAKNAPVKAKSIVDTRRAKQPEDATEWLRTFRAAYLADDREKIRSDYCLGLIDVRDRQ